MLATGLSLFALGVSELAHQREGTLEKAARLLGFGAALLILFALYSRRTSMPILKIGLLSRSGIAHAALIVFAAGFITFGAQIVLPIYFLQVRHYDANLAGLLLLPQAVGIGIGLPISGFLTDRYGAGRVVTGGATVVALGTAALALIETPQSDWWFIIAISLRGVGISMLSTPGLTKAVSLVERDDVPNVIPIMNVMNRFGGAVGTALVFVVHKLGSEAIPDGPQAALARFHASHWAMVAFLLALLIPSLALVRLEKQSG